ncbi:MAG TPA: hypothetical protein VGF79_14075 [Bacteroidia bacterium]
MKNGIILFVFALILCSGVMPESITKDEAIKIIKKINSEMFAQKNFATNLVYKIYKHHQDSVPETQMEGYYIRNGIKEHSMIVGVETIQDEKTRLIIDTTSQSIVITDPKIVGGVIDQSLLAALDYCSKIEKIVNGKDIELVLHIKEGFGIGFSKINVVVDSKLNWIKKLVLCYVNTTLPGFENFTSPKLEINYIASNDKKVERSEFEFDKYLIKSKGVFQLSEQYKNYTLTNIKRK